MDYNLLIESDLSASFFQPILDCYEHSSRKYNCTGVSDLEFAQLGILRVISESTTGQGCLQKLADYDISEMTVDHFFKALKSPRRLENLTSINDLMAVPVADAISDPYAEFDELKGWEVYAVDGHYQKHACHDPIFKNKKGENTYAPTGHFFRMNLRTHHMSVLDTMKNDPNDLKRLGCKKEHDARIIQRATKDAMRYNAPKGTKVLLVWDKACIDYQSWFKLKHQAGVYFMTMEKSNSAAEVMSNDRCDHSNPRNEGIESDVLVGVGQQTMRRIIYTNPMDNKTYTYLTNELTLPAYLLVSFYKHRWDIEKAFYQFKSKFNERKSWACSIEAKQAHAVFECLLHNLLLVMENRLKDEEGIEDQQSEALQKGRKPDELKGFINTIVQRCTNRPLRFIRWLRNSLFARSSWRRSMERLTAIWCLT